MHDQLQMVSQAALRAAGTAPTRVPMNGGLARGLMAAMLAGGILSAPLVVAAERNPALEFVQAQCIQEGMLRGFAGEALKGYVNACVEVKRHAPPPDLRQYSADPAAC